MELPSIHDQWHIADGWVQDNGWYIVRPDGEYAGPFTEDEAARLLPEFKKRYGERHGKSDRFSFG